MNTALKIILLAYPDNPVGYIFIETFQRHQVAIDSIIVKKQNRSNRWKRLIEKMNKDGLFAALKRILHMGLLKCRHRTLVHLAEKYQIPLCWVDRFNSQDCETWLKSRAPDLLVIVSAPILKENIFGLAGIGCLNPHPGWLPAYRGIGANAYALKNGDKPGVTIHFIDPEIDRGKIIFREHIPVQKGDTIARINDRAMKRGAELIIRAVHDIRDACLILPEITEPTGNLYKAMPYHETKIINRRLRKCVKK
ncbi:hypothetical protein JW835_04650 [bacterium]|nr:hypothetical protein [bacterium]RQV97200.1 MAG: hypothetical protein EH221_03975 [bacterium]